MCEDEDATHGEFKTTAAQRRAATNYRARNREQVNAAARERMARRRAAIAADPEQAALQRARVKVTNRRYRETHSREILAHDTQRRASKFIRRHGKEAWLDREKERRQRLEEILEQQELAEIEARALKIEKEEKERKQRQRKVLEGQKDARRQGRAALMQEIREEDDERALAAAPDSGMLETTIGNSNRKLGAGERQMSLMDTFILSESRRRGITIPADVRAQLSVSAQAQL
uniref:Uncharacterized protein n=1 Tax=Mycena chlorophos TaxID=658473 RepID=A0ABQ0KW26_MYCCL|nr:predicted protein [Mycena chlorophos]